MATRQEPLEDAQGEQTAVEIWELRIDVPQQWELIEESTVDVPGLDHTTDNYQIELTRKDGGWFPYYYCPSDRRLHGASQAYDNPQDAIDQVTAHIQRVRADKRNQAEQEAEAKRVEWPESVGRFHLVPDQHRPKRAVYKTRYLLGYTVLGAKYREKEITIQWYNDTELYYVDDGTFNAKERSFGRKASAIEAARQIMREQTEECNEIEVRAVENNDVPDHHIPEHIRSSS